MQTLLQDLRYSWRMLGKYPGFTLTAVLTLALGIGANTTVFSLVNAGLLRPLPIENPSRVVALTNVENKRLFPTFSYPNYRDFRDRNTVFSGLIAYRFAPLSLSHDGVNERLWGYLVSGNYFETLGVGAALGRVISTEDDRLPGAHPVAVVSHRGWQERFGGDPSIAGREVIVNGRSYTVIGVAQQGFNGTEIIAAPEIWFPMAMQAQIEPGSSWLEERGVENIFVQGRLKPGVSEAQAQTALAAIALELEREYPNVNEGQSVAVSPVGMMGGGARGLFQGFAGILMVVVGMVLLLACTNLANLLLARGAERRQEIAIRLALGAGRLRVIRQLLTESTALACLGGIGGLLLAFWLTGLAPAIKPPVDAPLFVELRMDYRVLAFTALVTILTGILFGLLPAWQATKTDIVSATKEETAGARRSWLKSSLIVFQVALSLVLLVGGGLVLRALQRAQSLDLGFEVRNAVEASFDLRLQGYDAGAGREFQKQLLERTRALPGVTGAGLADLVPVDLHFGSDSIFIEGAAPERRGAAPRALTNRISPGYFAALKTRLLRGREFTEQDDENAARVAIVNETFARRFWPGEDPIGKRFRTGSAESRTYEVIGVAEDGKYAGLNEDPKPLVYRALRQSRLGPVSLVVRSGGDPQMLLSAVRGEFRRLDPQLPLAGARTLEEHMSMPLLPARVAAASLGGFGALALALAAIGLYGVMSQSVAQRRREIGIRLALGAQASDIRRLIIGRGLTLTFIGMGIGLIASLGATRLMKSLLFGVSATDPLTFIGITLLLGAVALTACWIPAQRALRVDPLQTLRYE
ncbi:MAG: ABC transporter permease [Acidobacteria bacterium]|nr:ABC transporter permease [Acidobacteriota bacterium]